MTRNTFKIFAIEMKQIKLILLEFFPFHISQRSFLKKSHNELPNHKAKGKLSLNLQNCILLSWKSKISSNSFRIRCLCVYDTRWKLQSHRSQHNSFLCLYHSIQTPPSTSSLSCKSLFSIFFLCMFPWRELSVILLNEEAQACGTYEEWSKKRFWGLLI